MKILAAVDGSAYTKRMLAYLAAHDEWLGPPNELTLLNVVPAVPPRAASVIDRETIDGYYASEHEKVFKPLRAFFARQGLKHSFTGKVGQPGDVIPALAEKGRFDLVVMGSHGHGGLASLVLGSVATKVLAGCRVPVLLVR